MTKRSSRRWTVPLGVVLGTLSRGAAAYVASGASTSSTGSNGPGGPPVFLPQIPSWKTGPIVSGGMATGGIAPGKGDATGSDLNKGVAACGGAATCQASAGVSDDVQAPFSSVGFRVSNEHSGDLQRTTSGGLRLCKPTAGGLPLT
jgi:hypothetical protein